MKINLIYALKSIRRAPFQAISAVLVLWLGVVLAQVVILLSLGFSVVLDYFETRPQVTAFFTDKIEEGGILAIKKQLEQQTYVTKVTYVSKNDALALYKEHNKNDPLLLEMVTADILPPSLEVSASSANDLNRIYEDLQQVGGVEEVVYQKDVIDTLRRWSNGLRLGGMVLVVFLLAVSVVVINVVVSMKVAQKKEEIKTMRLIGATPWFVSSPFLIEGVIYGLIAAVAASITVLVLVLYSTPIMVGFMGEIPLLPVAWKTLIFLFSGSMLLGGLVGGLGVYLSISRY